MLAQIRSFAKSPWASGLLGLLVVSFAVWGIRDVFRAPNLKDSVVEAGDRNVTSPKFKKFYDNYKKQLEQQQNGGQPIANADALAAGVDTQLASELAYEESLNELIRREGVRPSDQLVAKQLATARSFINPVSGAFDRNAYMAYLAQNGLTAADVEGELRDELASNHFASGVTAGLAAPLVYSVTSSAYTHDGRSFTWINLPPNAVPAPTKPTDAQLQAFLKQNAAQLTKPETRVISITYFSANKFKGSAEAKPTDAEIQKRFDFEKDSLSKPETRSLVEIPAADAKQAADVARRLKAGEDPLAVAKSIGKQPVVLVDAPKSRIADSAVADAAFSLKAGEASGPIQGGLSFAVVKVSKVTPGRAATLADVKAKISDEVAQTKAQKLVQDQANAYNEAVNGGLHLADAAKKVGAPVVTLPPITKDGRSARESLPLPPALVQKIAALAFSSSEGVDGDVQEAQPGELYAIRVDKVIPPGPFTLDEIREPLTKRMMQQDLLKRLQAKAEEVQARWKKGEAPTSGASKAVAVQRDAAGVNAYGQEFLGALFAAKVGDVIIAPGKAGVIVAHVDAVAHASPAEVAKAAVASREGASRALAQEMATQTRFAARTIIKPKIDYRRARTAAGGDPDTLAFAADGSKPAQKPAAPAGKPSTAGGLSK